MKSIRLTSPSLDFWVDVRLIEHDGRWLAVAIITGDPEVGFGGSAFEASCEALASLGPDATQALMASLESA